MCGAEERDCCVGCMRGFSVWGEGEGFVCGAKERVQCAGCRSRFSIWIVGEGLVLRMQERDKCLGVGGGQTERRVLMKRWTTWFRFKVYN